MSSTWVPIPPLAEQHRIVAKVDAVALHASHRDERREHEHVNKRLQDEYDRLQRRIDAK